MNIKIKTLFILLTVSLSFTVFVLSYFISELYIHSNKLEKIEYNRYLMIQKADELRQSSDDLSRFANKYVITNDLEYRENYFNVLAIRNGELEKPKNYFGIYWDLSKELREQRHPPTNKISLKTEMKQLPYSKYEFQKLATSEKNSNDLVNLEVQAFNAMDGIFKDTNGKYTVKGEPNQELAIFLMNSKDYDRAKEKIMLPIDDFFNSVNSRTEKSIRTCNENIDKNFNIIFAILAVGIFILIFTTVLLIKKILYPIETLKDDMQNFKIGEDVKERSFYDDEIGFMAKQFYAMKNKINDDYKKIKTISITDPLTKIGNRKLLYETSKQLLNIAHRNHENISIMILDIDHFKKINDTYGHLVGDEILKFLVKNVNILLRKSDVFVRYGGEEFIVLLPKTDIRGAQIIADKIRTKIENSKLENSNNTIQITISIGITQYLNDNNEDINDMIKRADLALYKAKESGRNRVIVY